MHGHFCLVPRVSVHDRYYYTFQALMTLGYNEYAGLSYVLMRNCIWTMVDGYDQKVSQIIVFLNMQHYFDYPSVNPFSSSDVMCPVSCIFLVCSTIISVLLLCDYMGHSQITGL